MSNQKQVEAWHKEWLESAEPHWGDRIDWTSADEIARRLDEAQAEEVENCPVAGDNTDGLYYCTRPKGHDGPCAAVAWDS